MSSLVEGYNYDIFISYRQKDNKHDGWVTAFVENLRGELESTFKEEVSIYFDVNPHDGLLETHDVDASLREKLKCLVFIPIISRTYCDPKSFAWQHEFMAFTREASEDRIGLRVKLPNGNVASRILPVRIHDLDPADIKECEAITGGHLRGVEFIYKEPGVNKPLSTSDDDNKNLNKTRYRIQINKTANAIKEIISGIIEGKAGVSLKESTGTLPWEETARKKADKETVERRTKIRSGIATAAVILFLGTVYFFPDLFRRDALERLSGSDQLNIAVMPFQNLTNDQEWDLWQNQAKRILTADLTNLFFGSDEIKIRNEGSVTDLIKGENSAGLTTLSTDIFGTVSKKLEVDIYISGSILRAENVLRLDAGLVDTKTGTVLKSFYTSGPFDQVYMLGMIDSLRRKLTDFMLFSKLIKKNPYYQHNFTPPKSYEAIVYYEKARASTDPEESIKLFKKALEVDSTFYWAAFDLEHWYIYVEDCPTCSDSSRMWLKRNFERRNRMPDADRIYATWAYNYSFSPIKEQIKTMKELISLDEEEPWNHYLLGLNYSDTGQYEKAITEFKKTLEICGKWSKKDLKGNIANFFLAQAYIGAEQFDNARRLIRSARKDFPDSYDYLQARYFLAINDTSKAALHIENHKKIQKEKSISDFNILNDIAAIYDRSKFPDKAEEYYRKAAAIDPGNDAKLIDFLVNNNRKIPEALGLIEKNLPSATSTRYYTLMCQKGYCFYQMGNVQEGYELIQKAWDETPFRIYYGIGKYLDEVKKAVGQT